MLDKIFKMFGGGKKSAGEAAMAMLVPMIVDYIKDRFGDELGNLIENFAEPVEKGDTGNLLELGNKIISMVTSGDDKPDWLDLLNNLGDDDKMKLAMEVFKRLKG